MARRRKPTQAAEPGPSPGGPPGNPGRCGPAAALLLAAATTLAYVPCLSGRFLLDDHLLLTENALIHADDGLRRIWFTTDAVDYWPIFNSVLWLGWRAWGADPVGYHVLNLVLHVGTALLFWRLLGRLAAPGAFLAALLFALHPVNVESVAWITQLKNLLALLFCLLSALAWLEDEERPGRPDSAPGRWYVASLATFLAAMLSKASVAVLPVLLLGLVAARRRPGGRDLIRTLPFFGIGAALTVVNLWFQSRFEQSPIADSFTERLLGAGAVVWFYLGKALLPLHLSFVYPRWNIEAGDWTWWLPLTAALLATGLLWLGRRGAARPLLFAWGFFCLALAPVMGFTDVGFMAHSLVADHYQHMALLGVTAVVAGTWERWRRSGTRAGIGVPHGVAAAVVATLLVLTWRQSALYADGVTLFEATARQNPGSPFVHNNLGLALLEQGRTAEALAAFRRALALRPDYPEADYNLGRTLLSSGDPGAAVAPLQRAVERRPLPVYRGELGAALTRARRFPEAIRHFRREADLAPDSAAARNDLANVLFEAGQLDEAKAQYERAVRLDPRLVAARYNLGRCLLRAGRTADALPHLQEAVRLDPRMAEAHNALGVALAGVGRPADAVAHLEEAARLSPADGEIRANLEEVRASIGTPVAP